MPQRMTFSLDQHTMTTQRTLNKACVLLALLIPKGVDATHIPMGASNQKYVALKNEVALQAIALESLFEVLEATEEQLDHLKRITLANEKSITKLAQKRAEENPSMLANTDPSMQINATQEAIKKSIKHLKKHYEKRNRSKLTSPNLDSLQRSITRLRNDNKAAKAVIKARNHKKKSYLNICVKKPVVPRKKRSALTKYTTIRARKYSKKPDLNPYVTQPTPPQRGKGASTKYTTMRARKYIKKPKPSPYEKKTITPTMHHIEKEASKQPCDPIGLFGMRKTIAARHSVKKHTQPPTPARARSIKTPSKSEHGGNRSINAMPKKPTIIHIPGRFFV